MRINTRLGPMETRRIMTPGPLPDMVTIDEIFTLPIGFRGTREGRVRTQVLRALYNDNPNIADRHLRDAIERMAAVRETEVEPQGGFVPNPRLHLGGYLPPHYVADDLVAANREMPRRPQATGGVTRVPRPNNPNPINIMAGAFTNGGATFTNVDALINGETFNIAWTPNGEATANLQQEDTAPPLRLPEKTLCSCGHPDDPNWVHAHGECTFLDRPTSEFYDEGAAPGR